MRWLRAAVAFGLVVTLGGATAAPYTSLTREFAEFFDRSAGQSEAERVLAFKQRFGPLFPGFYEPAEGQAPEQFDQTVARSLANFPALRAKYEQTERDFPRAYAAGIDHFRKQFPGFKPIMPVWFVHSLGRMDGGTRSYAGQNYMIFGADVIARIHTSRDLGPFLDHELFHVEHSQWFKDCDALWCSLWQEGLATYAAGVMNPGADDTMLMLNEPKPIRAAVDADWAGALCQTRTDFDSTDKGVYAGYFFGGDRQQKYPSRWGYYVGLRLAQRMGAHRSLAALDHLTNDQARPLVAAELDAMIHDAGGCPTA
jgi:hypothetical protein